jgi:fumarate reductase flavoprotein subunit
LFRAGAILVNRDGARYCNELGNAAVATNSEPDRLTWLLFDSQVAAQVAVPRDDSSPGVRDGWKRAGKLFVSTFPGVAYAYLEDLQRTAYFCRAATMGELADGTGLPQDAIERSLREWNDDMKGAVS